MRDPGGGGTDGINFAPSDTVSDPRVIYDPASQRWFASQVKYDGERRRTRLWNPIIICSVFPTLTIPAARGMCFRSSRPRGRSSLQISQRWAWMPKPFIWPATCIPPVTNSLGTSLTMIPKADLLANPPIITNRIFFGATDYAARGAVLQPVTCLDGSSSGNILAAGALGDDFLFHSNLVASTVLNPGATNATLAPGTNISVEAYTAPLDATQPDGMPRSRITTRGSAPGFIPSAASFLPSIIPKWTDWPRSDGIVSTPPITPCWNRAPSRIRTWI